jgi:D-alanyl-D-alanine carboxypeptidase/D-alanyl-D-alanine-endopeptidase (penicillin-binding protein 4)
MADGSGLSRYNLATADALASILTYLAKTPELGETFEACLPVAGASGTLETRFRNTAAAGIVHAKTGSIAEARSLSGYVGRPPAGRWRSRSS